MDIARKQFLPVRAALCAGLLALVVVASGEAGVVDPATGHYYELVNLGAPISWNDAAAAAAAMSYEGCSPAHLATIADAAENAIITGQLLAHAPLYGYWIGAVAQGQGCNPGDWSWYTGEPWTYANWAVDEPNCGNPDTPNIHMYGCEDPYDPAYCGYWNDTSNQWGEARGYIIEIDVTCPPVKVVPKSWGALKTIYR